MRGIRGSRALRAFPPARLLGLIVVWSLAPALADDFDAGTEAYLAGDFSTAVSLWEPLAEDSHLQAQLGLGKMFEKGSDELPRDEQLAAEWYRRAAVAGLAEAQMRLADLHRAGHGVEQDPEQAFALYRKSAFQGWPAAEYRLGASYETGFGVRQNYANAVVWFRRAAEDGNVDARYRLGDLYFFGLGLKRDLDEARVWYRQAVREGDSRALFRLRLLGETDPSETVVIPPPPVPKPIRRAAAETTVATAKSVRVQLGSFGNRERAALAWNRLRRSHADLLRSLQAEFAAIDLGSGRGTHVRLLVGSFPEKAAARALCARLKERAADCFVIMH